MHVRSKFRFVVVAMLCALPLEGRAAAPADAFAQAVRVWFDAPEAAGVALEALQEAYPDDDDVAWWLARVRLDQGREAEAAALLAGRTGRKVPGHRFAWLRARLTAASDPAGARAELAAALASPGASTDPDRVEMRALAARLAWRAGDDADALAHVRAEGGALPGFAAWARPAGGPPLRVESEGRVHLVTGGGLVVEDASAACPEPSVSSVASAPAADTPVEAPGPTLLRALGGSCLGPGARAWLAPAPGGWGYVALDAPEGEGIFTIDGCGAPPHAVRRGPGLSSPAWLGSELLWIEGGAANATRGPLWTGAEVLRLTPAPDGVLVVVWEAGAPRLRRAASLDAPLTAVFSDDPPISRATACPSPPAGSAPGAPPPRPARPR